MKGGVISKSEILASYMEEVKRDLIKHLGKNIPKKVTDNMSVSTSNEDECLAGESQDEDEMDIEEFLQQFSSQVEESSSSKNDKGKGIAKD